MLGWSQEDMALASRVSVPTIKRLEAAGGTMGGRETTVANILDALESAGVIFINENGEGPGVRLRKSIAPDPKS
jgi:predicted transcriptional regulator